jgi:hypothetical protein
MCIPRVDMWIHLIVRTTLDCRYHAILHELLHVSCFTFANRIHSLDGFLTFLGLHAFTIATAVTPDVSGKFCCSYRDKFQSGLNRIRLYSAKCLVAVALLLLHTLKDNTLLQYPVYWSLGSRLYYLQSFRANLFFIVCVRVRVCACMCVRPTYFDCYLVRRLDSICISCKLVVTTQSYTPKLTKIIVQTHST